MATSEGIWSPEAIDPWFDADPAPGRASRVVRTDSRADPSQEEETGFHVLSAPSSSRRGRAGSAGILPAPRATARVFVFSPESIPKG